jgi:hypothetical protein
MRLEHRQLANQSYGESLIPFHIISKDTPHPKLSQNSSLSFQYKHVLVTGATSGIGKGLSERFVKAGIKVTAVGRRRDRLDEFVSIDGTSKASGVAFEAQLKVR